MSWVINFSNSILGVGLLALPYCFSQCGVILTTIMVLVAAYLTKRTCEYLLLSGNVTRKSSYEQIAFHVYGPMGKLVIEICTIGLLLGTLVAFQVVIGDLAPAVVNSFLGMEKTWFLRLVLMIASNFVIFPLCMLRNVSSLASMNMLSVCFYLTFCFLMFCYAAPEMFFMKWWETCNMWNPFAIFKVLPIILLSFSCQVQVFNMYSGLPEPNVTSMMEIINKAINLCSAIYISVGMFGYIAFYHGSIHGDILESFQPGFLADLVKLGFCASVILSFPLIVFPVRASINSMLFDGKNQGNVLQDMISSAADYIAPDKFLYITMTLIGGTLCVGVLVPHIEVVLSITGALVGTFLCFIMPSALFIAVAGGGKMRHAAKLLLVFSILAMVISTTTVLNDVMAQPKPKSVVAVETPIQTNIQKHTRDQTEDLQTLVTKLPPVVIATLNQTAEKAVSELIIDSKNETEVVSDVIKNNEKIIEESNKILNNG